MDRNKHPKPAEQTQRLSLSARRAWIEILHDVSLNYKEVVALRKESVDRNCRYSACCIVLLVALRKESVDRNSIASASSKARITSLSARRAWIEIPYRPGL